jgi:hypothetical protein
MKIKKIIKRLEIILIIIVIFTIFGSFLPFIKGILSFGNFVIRFNILPFKETSFASYNSLIDIFAFLILISSIIIILVAFLALKLKLKWINFLSILQILLGSLVITIVIIDFFLFRNLIFKIILTHLKKIYYSFVFIIDVDVDISVFTFFYFFIISIKENIRGYISTIPSFGFYLILISGILVIIVSILIIWLKRTIKMEKIKEVILQIETKRERIRLSKLAEKCGEKESLIISTIKKMIKNKEIMAEYFYTTRTITFSKEINIEEIDELIESFKKWEQTREGKVE